MKRCFCFSALDTWFFRESRPHGSVGFNELDSAFPPPVRTLAGALRTAIGDAMNVDWRHFHEDHEAAKVIGHGDDYGPLSFSGPWLTLDKQRIYPWPLNLLGKEEGGAGLDLLRLELGAPVSCHLGRLTLPQLPAGKRGYAPREGSWLTSKGLETILAGGIPAAGDIISERVLVSRESRLGIALDHQRGTVHESLLYQTRHLRPHESLGVELEVEGLPDALPLPSVLRLGGESRLAALEETRAATLPSTEIPPGEKHFVLYLMTPAQLENGWLPPGFSQMTADDGTHFWRGGIEGMTLNIHAAIISKARREGGWNQIRKRPRPVCSLVPAGSLYYCSMEDGHPARLHGCQIGAGKHLGYGMLATGRWPDEERWSSSHE